MATFFGEILPVRSRAVDDDEDDDFRGPIEGEPILHWSKKVKAETEKLPDKKVPCSNLVISIGQEANAFTEVYVKTFKYEIIGGIFSKIQDDDPCTLSQTSPTDKSCFIYRCYSNPSIIVCQCNRDVSQEQSFSWAKLLCTNINLDTAYIAVLASCSTGGYCSDIPSSDLDTPFLRALKTEKFVGTPICKILEQPNMLTGLPAQLMTFFQVHQYKAVIYVCYKENRYADIPSVKAFLPVLEVTPIKDMTEPNKKAEDMLRDIVEKHQIHDMLYL
ncbi:proteasome assembly chaperone 1 [Aplysia californica]|uniref:Proteasome assembly chaperone 1 n=1 Tax=Aplysia californica TaxID=6500 RepID=A0ABM0JRX4_APLCA|nr:proteasome assembly chaperone 1 [Aplysia californica]